MFGACPAIFRSLLAVHEVVRGYEEEEKGELWTVVTKKQPGDMGIITWYKPCRMRDLNEAKADGWSIF